VALVACPDTSWHAEASRSVGSVSVGRVQLFVSGTLVGPALLGQLQWLGLGSLLSGFVGNLWISSGPGPTFTDEVVLCSIQGAQPAGIQTSGSWTLTQPLPIAARPFNIATDAFFLAHNDQYVASGDFHQFQLYSQVCQGTASTDCCAELNGKLDQVLAAVTRVYPRTP
jgi:hypothetical protein